MYSSSDLHSRLCVCSNRSDYIQDCVYTSSITLCVCVCSSSDYVQVCVYSIDYSVCAAAVIYIQECVYIFDYIVCTAAVIYIQAFVYSIDYIVCTAAVIIFKIVCTASITLCVQQRDYVQVCVYSSD